MTGPTPRRRRGSSAGPGPARPSPRPPRRGYELDVVLAVFGNWRRRGRHHHPFTEIHVVPVLSLVMATAAPSLRGLHHRGTRRTEVGGRYREWGSPRERSSRSHRPRLPQTVVDARGSVARRAARHYSGGESASAARLMIPSSPIVQKGLWATSHRKPSGSAK